MYVGSIIEKIYEPLSNQGSIIKQVSGNLHSADNDISTHH